MLDNIGPSAREGLPAKKVHNVKVHDPKEHDQKAENTGMNLDPQEVKPSITRLKRARGQIDAVIRMLEAGEDCEAAVTQLAAAAKAIDRAGYSIIATGMRQCFQESGPDGIDAAKMEKLFLSLS